MTPSFIEELSGQLKKFKTYLDTPIQQNRDTDIKNLSNHIKETSDLLEKTKYKLTKPFNRNLPDYPDKNLEELIYYQQTITKIQNQLDKLQVTDESLKQLVDDFSKKINYYIKLHLEKKQPKTKDRPPNRQ
ncbi:hypothetical protein JYQ62_28485 [Nostoc sp. UHCC 0702]|nr:hypothetical protein JYQ62_28485 [Nostoc sp. UHCC 0702]